MLIQRITNARLSKQPGLWNITIDGGKILSVERGTAEAEPPEGLMPWTMPKAQPDGVELDAGGRLVSPPFVEPHVHLDTALTAGQPEWNRTGTLFEGVQRWAQRKATLTQRDVEERALRAIRWQVAGGVQFVRTHCDVTDPQLTALRALLELKARLADVVTLQIVAFPQEGIVSFPNGHALMVEALEMGADVVGATPHLEFTRDDGVSAVKQAFDLAERFDRQVDVHCDEIDDEQSRFLEVVASEAHHRQMGQRVAASHTTAMGSYNDAYAFKLFRLLGLSQISFIANPLVNIHLQGRFDSYPKRRGLTRVKELLASDLNVCFGHDDLFDPWYPLGTANMLQVLHMGLHVCQLMGYDDIDDSLRLITTHSARALGLQDYGIAVGLPANLIILDASSEYDAVRRQSAVLVSLREGRVIARTRPSETQVDLDGTRRTIDFTL